ncbi:MAG: TlpA family protein disulfide reductase [Planctomycetota bacterium]|jgi:hypothetical protein
MYGHEKQLLLKLKDKPFAILGINSDTTREKAKAVVAEKQHVTRTWWDGGSTRGPIAKAWNVKGWPTIYILDHKGVIRFKGARGEAMDAAPRGTGEGAGLRRNAGAEEGHRRVGRLLADDAICAA